MKGENIKWYVICVILGLWLIGSGIQGVRNRRSKNLAYFILSVGEIILGISSLIILIIGFWVRELGSNLFGLLPK